MDSQKTLEAALQPLKDQVRARSEVYEPGDSYWYHRPTLNFPPRAVRYSADYDGSERLSLSVTQTDLSAAKQRDLVREWCALLPTLGRVRTLWFQSKVTQELFDAACAMPGLEGLYIKWSAITSLAPMAGLKNLSHFHLGGAPSAEHLDTLAQLPKLVDLEISNVRAAGDLRFLQGLSRLRALAVSGDSNSLKAMKMDGLAPIAQLRELERLNLSTVQLDDGSLASLVELPKLRFLGLSNKFPMEEFARLAGRRPDIHCDRFKPTWGPVASLRCKVCGKESMHLLTGKGMPFLCEHCDAPRLAKHKAAFEAIVRAAATG